MARGTLPTCLSAFGLVTALTGCAAPPVQDICGRTVTQTENYGSVRSADQAIREAVKSGSFESGPGITSSMTASVGMTVTRKSGTPSADCR